MVVKHGSTKGPRVSLDEVIREGEFECERDWFE